MRGFVGCIATLCIIAVACSFASAQGSWGGYGSSGNGPEVTYQANWGGYQQVYATPRAHYGSWGGTYSTPVAYSAPVVAEVPRVRVPVRGVRLRLAVPVVRRTRLAVHYHGSSG